MINNEKPSLEELVHRRVDDYDPVKAHQYYMRTRELKGRQIKKVPKGFGGEDAVYNFDPTLRRILTQGQSIIDIGQSFVKRFFN